MPAARSGSTRTPPSSAPAATTGRTKSTENTQATARRAVSRVEADTGTVKSHRSQPVCLDTATPTPNWNVTVPRTEKST